jgi:hypothetical protein
MTDRCFFCVLLETQPDGTADRAWCLRCGAEWEKIEGEWEKRGTHGSGEGDVQRHEHQ